MSGARSAILGPSLPAPFFSHPTTAGRAGEATSTTSGSCTTHESCLLSRREMMRRRRTGGSSVVGECARKTRALRAGQPSAFE